MYVALKNISEKSTMYVLTTGMWYFAKKKIPETIGLL